MVGSMLIQRLVCILLFLVVVLRTELTFEQADEKYVVRVDPGKAYVKGYEVGYKNALYVYGNKPRETSFRGDSITQITEGNNVTVTNVYGTPDLQNITGDGTSLAYDSIKVYRNFTDGFVGEGTDTNGRPLNLGNEPWKTYHVIADRNISGSTTGLTEIYKEGNSALLPLLCYRTWFCYWYWCCSERL